MNEVNTKKEIRDIMLEMESLSERQLATTLTEETLKELMESNGLNATNVGAMGSNGSNNSCNDSNCTRTIDFCCKTSITKGFNVNINNNLTGIQFNTSLFCFVDPCPCNVNCTPGENCDSFCIALYPTRIIGCIQFRVFTGNATGESCAGSGCELTLNGPITFEGSICVNKIVNYQQCPPTLRESQPKLIPDSNITASVTATAENCELVLAGGTPVVKFTGSFTLPTDCPTPTCPNPPCTPPVCPTVCPG